MQRSTILRASYRAGFAAAMLMLAAPVWAAGTVNVLYAGSLVNLMERSLGPAFERASGDHFLGYAGGSQELANEIKGRLRRGDVFISASPSVNRSLSGPANGDWVSWYVAFAQSPIVIGYNPQSRFAAKFAKKPWYRVLLEPGIQIGRTDPKLDPKGRLTLALMKKAAAFYKIPDLAHRVLGPPENPAQVFPEEALIGRLQSGQLDAGFFYASETAEAKIPSIALPSQLAPKARYTITILRDAPNGTAARQFLRFVLGPSGRRLLRQHGLTPVAPRLSGSAPPPVRSLIDRSK